MESPSVLGPEDIIICGSFMRVENPCFST